MGMEMAEGGEAFVKGPLWLHFQPTPYLPAALQKEAL